MDGIEASRVLQQDEWIIGRILRGLFMGCMLNIF